MGKIFSGALHAAPEEFKNAAFFLWLGLSSTPIRHGNGAFRKRSSNRSREFKNTGFALCGQKTFRKRRGYNNHMISLLEFYLNTNSNSR